jgi:hypothetical protein
MSSWHVGSIMIVLLQLGFSKCFVSAWILPSSLSTRPSVSSLRSDDFCDLESLEVHDDDDSWQFCLSGQPYISPVLWESDSEWKDFVLRLQKENSDPDDDPADYLWEQIKLEATAALGPEP